jgi:putative membrane-bound dehydrogenase-like protein
MAHRFALHHRRLAAGLLLFLSGMNLPGQLAGGSAGAEPPATGPETEKRFPLLVVPANFQATLFACDPLIEYPSAIAVGPKVKPGSVFVAIDYMTGLGTEIVRRDEIRLVEDTDRDGYADKASVFADGFNSIMGLTFHGGTVYVMHSPFLTALRDTDGDGKSDERRELLSGLGLPPEQNDVRLHCANGVVMGHDGWLYLALGDHGCDVPRPEGDRLVYHGGGILRCRPDGRDLHLFASGLRNIYDVALDDDLNVFVRDNENDGGDYKIRVCYSFHGADHGYPYLYYERPDEALPPLADLGLGSSAGGAAYLERQFPAEYQGSLFFCEWGKSVVRYHPQRTGSGFGPLPETEFAVGAANDPYGFKPTDLIVDRDGSLVVADWCDGQRPKRGRGRIYRITHREASIQPAPKRPPDSLAEVITQLDSESQFDRVEAQDAISARGPEGLKAVCAAIDAKNRLGTRARMHAIWILARDGSDASREMLFELAAGDPDPRVQVQAVRALADLYDPVLAGDKLEAPPADAAVAERLAALAGGKDPRVVLEIVVALGRLKWSGAPQWAGKLFPAGSKLDPILAHAAQQTLRRSANWPAILALVDLPDAEPLRPVALRAVCGQFLPEVADGLIQRLEGGDARRRGEYASALARVYNEPGPWEYWGYRPQPRPANTVAWDRTKAIEEALDQALADPDRTIRLAVLRQMQRENVSVTMERLAAWLSDERGEEAVAAIVSSLPAEPADFRRALLKQIVTDRDQVFVNRLRALDLFLAEQSPPSPKGLQDLIKVVEDGPVLAALLRPLQAATGTGSMRYLNQKLDSPAPEVRVAAIEALAATGRLEAGMSISGRIEDKDVLVRRAAAAAVGRLKVASGAEPLIRVATDRDPAVRRAAFISLGQLRNFNAAPLAVAALADPETQQSALFCLAEIGWPEHAEPIMTLAENDPSEAVVLLAARALAKWGPRPDVMPELRADMERAIRRMQGRSGLVVVWQTSGPLADDVLSTTRTRLLASRAAQAVEGNDSPWQTSVGAGVEAPISIPDASLGANSYLAYADVTVAEATPAQFLASAGGTLQVWLNGRPVHERKEPRRYEPNSDLFEATLEKGDNRLVIQVSGSADSTDKSEFHLRFRRKSSTARLEQLMQAALSRTGDVERGRKLFLDAAKSQCIKCHQIGSQGERIGPELTGLGDRFSRIHIVESILEPSRTVTPGFQTLLVRLADGSSVSGIKLTEDDRTLTLADQKGEKHKLAKAEIEAQHSQVTSTMPDNLTQQFSPDQFVDLVTFLVSQKQGR